MFKKALTEAAEKHLLTHFIFMTMVNVLANSFHIYQ